MNCDGIKLMISEYLDDALLKEKEVLLFTHISICANCREEFKQQNLIQHTVKINQRDVPGRLEDRIFDSIRHGENKQQYRWFAKPVPAYINIILGIVLVIIVLFSYLQVSSLRYDLNDIKVRYDTALERIQYQSQQMNLLMNNAPAVKITGQPIKIIN